MNTTGLLHNILSPSSSVCYLSRLPSHQQLLTVGGEDDVGDGVGVVLHTLALHHFILE